MAGRIKSLLRNLGPGLITGASDDDPSGIATYAAAGAALGYGPLWSAPFTFPLMAAVQFICAKIGLVSGRGIAGVLRQHYSRALLYPAVLVLLIANTINAGADLLAIAAGANLLVPVPVNIIVWPIGLLLLLLLAWGSYRAIANTFKWLTLSLLAYIAAAFFAKPDWQQVAWNTFIPTLHLDGQFLMMLVAILGTTISPYMFFWQANQEVEEERALGRRRVSERRGATDEELECAAFDVNVGMFVSNLVMYFIILGSAATLHQAGHLEVGSAAEAAEGLRPLAGDAATALMALGLIGSGCLAVPVLTASAAFAVCEAFGWKCGLNHKPARAPRFYAIIAASTLLGLLLNLTGIDPMQALVWTAVLNGLLAPPLLVVVMLVANNKEVMGERVNSRWLNVLGWATTILMFAAAVGLIFTWRST